MNVKELLHNTLMVLKVNTKIRWYWSIYNGAHCRARTYDLLNVNQLL